MGKVIVRSMVGEVITRRREPAFEYEFKEKDGKVTAEVEEEHAKIICRNPAFIIEEEQKGSFRKIKDKKPEIEV